MGKLTYRMKKSLNIKNGYLIGIGVFSLFLIVGSFSYALFTVQTESKGTLNIITGNLHSYIESEELGTTNSIVLNSKETRVITMNLKNLNPIDAKFNLWYEAAEGVEVSYDNSKDAPPSKAGYKVETEGVKTYKLKITNNRSEEQKIQFGSEVGLENKNLSFPEGKRVIEGIVPKVKMDSNMIQVVYDGSKWVKAGENNWYDYDLGRWANAVTVTSATRANYQSAASGTEINMNDIETMWVWVPRYSYTIGSVDGTNYYGKQGIYLSDAPTQSLPGEIDIKFIGKTEKDTENAKYKVSEGRSGWRTPDAFTFGEEELSGIWVGKFETSSSTQTAENGGGNTAELDPIIKPNVISWRAIQAANIGEVGRKLNATGNRYGFSTSLVSHAMKNDEWAAVAYLSQSKYGKLGNLDYSNENKEIYQNKSDSYITGCSSGGPSKEGEKGCPYTYDISLTGTGSSTTGTIYGIYDMSGGAHELLMANFKKYSGQNDSSNSGYTGSLGVGGNYSGKAWLEDKYYNFYVAPTDTENSTAVVTCNKETCISHALTEVSGWYGDNVMTGGEIKYPWMTRGGNSSEFTSSGIFRNNQHTGNGASDISLRLVLS